MADSKVETSRLKFIRSNKKSLCADLYKKLYDAISGTDAVDQFRLGTKTILLLSFCGSQRDMHRRYQDAMCIDKKFGKPDLFITFTFNPSWVEVTDALVQGRSAPDRPDLVTMVFKQKVDELINCILKKHIFGVISSFMLRVEIRKRRLHHIHLILILEDRRSLKYRNKEY